MTFETNWQQSFTNSFIPKLYSTEAALSPFLNLIPNRAETLPSGAIFKAMVSNGLVDSVGLSAKSRVASTPDFYVDNTHTGTNAGTLANPFQSFTALFASAALTVFGQQTIFIRATGVPYRVVTHGHFRSDKCFGNKFYFDWDGVTATGRGAARAQVWASENASAKTGNWTQVGASNVWYHDNIDNVDTTYVNVASSWGAWWVRGWPNDVVVLRGRNPHNDTDIETLAPYEYFYNGAGRLYVNVGGDPSGEYIEYGSTATPSSDKQTFEIYTGQEIYRGVFRFGRKINSNGHCSGWIIAGCELKYAGITIFDSGVDRLYTADFYNPACIDGSCTYSGADGCSPYVKAPWNLTVPESMRTRPALLVGNDIGVCKTNGILFNTSGGTGVVGGTDIIIAFNLIGHVAGLPPIYPANRSMRAGTQINVFGNVIYDWKSSLGAIRNYGDATKLMKFKLRNNIFLNIDGQYPALYSSDHANAQWDSDYNRFYAQNGAWTTANLVGTACPNLTDAGFEEGAHSTAGNPVFADITAFARFLAAGTVGAYDFHMQSGSPCRLTGISPFVDGNGDQYDADGYQIWSDTTNLPDGHWLDGVDIGAYAYGGDDPYFLSLLGPDGAKYWPSASELIAITGVDNAVYNADGTGKTFATPALALAAMATVEDNIKLFVGEKGAVLYSTDMSAQLAKIQRAGY